MMKKIIVQIIRSWDYPDWRRMSPQGSMTWDNVIFTEDHVAEPDYVVVLNQPTAPITVNVAPDRIWAIIQEPPTNFHRYLHKGQKAFGRIYTSDPEMIAKGVPYIASFPVLPWHVDKDFDDLARIDPFVEKTRDLSWITSTLAFLPGHKIRMALLNRLKGQDFISFFGRGLRPIEDKWDALAPFRYSIVVENHHGPYYWSEKLIDCFLAGAMPIYFGCSNLADYFPKNSFIQLDPNNQNLIEEFRSIIASNRAEEYRADIREARNRCLYKWQILPFIVDEIRKDQNFPSERRNINLVVKTLKHPFHKARAIWYWKIAPKLPKIFK
jgi:hypothetical protein